MKNSVYKKWWFWLVIALIIILIIIGAFVIYNKKQPIINNLNNNQENETDKVLNETNNNITILLYNETGNFKLTIKASNPQYKVGQDIPIKYTIENIDNKTIAIPKDISNGIEIKDAGGRKVEYTGEGNLFFINDSFAIDPNKSASSEFTINGEDYELTKIGSAGEGYYNSLNFYIGEVKSNTIILRIVK